MHKSIKCPQKPEALDPMELELQVVVRNLTWMLGTKLVLRDVCKLCEDVLLQLV